MRNLSIVLLFVGSLCGCESYDLRGAGDNYLESMNEPGLFRWKTLADAVYPIDGDKAEKARLRQMAIALDKNPACQGGYTVEQRQATKRVDGLLGDVYDVFYTVRCR